MNDFRETCLLYWSWNRAITSSSDKYKSAFTAANVPSASLYSILQNNSTLRMLANLWSLHIYLTIWKECLLVSCSSLYALPLIHSYSLAAIFKDDSIQVVEKRNLFLLYKKATAHTYRISCILICPRYIVADTKSEHFLEFQCSFHAQF